jgi:thiol-disulfide isomerase/thioredoxin
MVAAATALSAQQHGHQTDPVWTINRLLANRDSFPSIAYTLDFKMKSFSMDDTLTYLADVKLVRNSVDTIFGGWVSVDMDSLWLGYDGALIYAGNRRSSELRTADPVLAEGAFIKSTYYNNLIDEGHLQNNKGLLSLVTDGELPIDIIDTLIGETPCVGVKVYIPDQEGFTRQRLFVAIEKSGAYIRHRSYTVLFQESEQYQEWNYSNVTYGPGQDLAALSPESLGSFRTVTTYEVRDIEDDPGPEVMVEALRGVWLVSREAWDMEHNQSKFVLLDFWYAACYPCIKSIPQVNQLHEALKDKGVLVLGVNPIDQLDKDDARLERFLRNNPMSYPTLMPDEESRAALQVPGFPTLLVLDQERNVIYAETGFSENMYEEVMEVLAPLLK